MIDSSLNIRQASIADVEELVKLRIALLQEVGDIEESTNENIEALGKAIRCYLNKKIPSSEFVAWVAETNNYLVATSGMIFLERPPFNGNLSGLEAYLMNVYTVPLWRGKGIATALLRETLKFAKQTEARRIWLHATEDGKHIYEKFGFVSTIKEMELVW